MRPRDRPSQTRDRPSYTRDRQLHDRERPSRGYDRPPSRYPRARATAPEDDMELARPSRFNRYQRLHKKYDRAAQLSLASALEKSSTPETIRPLGIIGGDLMLVKLDGVTVVKNRRFESASEGEYSVCRDSLQAIVAAKYPTVDPASLLNYRTTPFEFGGFLTAIEIAPLGKIYEGLVRSNKRDAECSAAFCALAEMGCHVLPGVAPQLSECQGEAHESLQSLVQQSDVRYDWEDDELEGANGEQKVCEVEQRVCEVEEAKDEESMSMSKPLVELKDATDFPPAPSPIASIELIEPIPAPTHKVVGPDYSTRSGTISLRALLAPHESEAVDDTNYKLELVTLLNTFLRATLSSVLAYETERVDPDSIVVVGFRSRLTVFPFDMVIEGATCVSKKAAENSAAKLVLGSPLMRSLRDSSCRAVIKRVQRSGMAFPTATATAADPKGALIRIILRAFAKDDIKGNPIVYLTKPAASGTRRGFSTELFIEALGIHMRGPICLSKKEAEKTVAKQCLALPVVEELEKKHDANSMRPEDGLTAGSGKRKRTSEYDPSDENAQTSKVAAVEEEPETVTEEDASKREVIVLLLNLFPLDALLGYLKYRTDVSDDGGVESTVTVQSLSLRACGESCSSADAAESSAARALLASGPMKSLASFFSSLGRYDSTIV